MTENCIPDWVYDRLRLWADVAEAERGAALLRPVKTAGESRNAQLLAAKAFGARDVIPMLIADLQAVDRLMLRHGSQFDGGVSSRFIASTTPRSPE